MVLKSDTMGTEVTDHAAEQIDSSQAARPTVDQMIRRLFDHWGLGDGDRAALMACSTESLQGDESIASNEAAERAGHLLAIHAKLRTLFPQNRDVAYSWMTLANRALGDQTPVEVVRAQGLDGLRAVRGYLERAVGC